MPGSNCAFATCLTSTRPAHSPRPQEVTNLALSRSVGTQAPSPLLSLLPLAVEISLPRRTTPP